MAEFTELKGKTLTSININDLKDNIIFITSEKDRYMMLHERDCCKSVTIEDISGDLCDLLESPIAVVEEVINNRIALLNDIINK